MSLKKMKTYIWSVSNRRQRKHENTESRKMLLRLFVTIVYSPSTREPPILFPTAPKSRVAGNRISCSQLRKESDLTTNKSVYLMIFDDGFFRSV